MLGIGKEGGILSKAVWVDPDHEVNNCSTRGGKGVGKLWRYLEEWAEGQAEQRPRGCGNVLSSFEERQGAVWPKQRHRRGGGGEGRFAAVQTSKGHCKDLGFALSGTGSQSSVSSREVT